MEKKWRVNRIYPGNAFESAGRGWPGFRWPGTGQRCDRRIGISSFLQRRERTTQSCKASPCGHEFADRLWRCRGISGDIIVGDVDGVVVIPRHLADEIAADAAEQEHLGDFIITLIQDGAPLRGTYPPDDATKAAYEAWKQKAKH